MVNLRVMTLHTRQVTLRQSTCVYLSTSRWSCNVSVAILNVDDDPYEFILGTIGRSPGRFRGLSLSFYINETLPS